MFSPGRLIIWYVPGRSWPSKVLLEWTQAILSILVELVNWDVHLAHTSLLSFPQRVMIEWVSQGETNLLSRSMMEDEWKVNRAFCWSQDCQRSCSKVPGHPDLFHQHTLLSIYVYAFKVDSENSSDNGLALEFVGHQSFTALSSRRIRWSASLPAAPWQHLSKPGDRIQKADWTGAVHTWSRTLRLHTEACSRQTQQTKLLLWYAHLCRDVISVLDATIWLDLQLKESLQIIPALHHSNPDSDSYTRSWTQLSWLYACTADFRFSCQKAVLFKCLWYLRKLEVRFRCSSDSIDISNNMPHHNSQDTKQASTNVQALNSNNSWEVRQTFTNEEIRNAFDQQKHLKRVRIARASQHILTSAISIIVAALQARLFIIYQRTKTYPNCWPKYPNLLPTLMLMVTAFVSLFIDVCALIAYAWPGSGAGRRAFKVGQFLLEVFTDHYSLQILPMVFRKHSKHWAMHIQVLLEMLQRFRVHNLDRWMIFGAGHAVIKSLLLNS